MAQQLRFTLAQIGVPKVKWEKDMDNGGARQVVEIGFKIPNLPKELQAELAAQAHAGNLAHLSVELTQQSFYLTTENSEAITHVRLEDFLRPPEDEEEPLAE